MRRIWQWSGLVALATMGGACAAEPVGHAEREDLELEATRVAQALGEPGCGSVAPDDAFATGQTFLDSKGDTYGHPECKDGYVVDLPAQTAGMVYRGGTALVKWPDPFTCLLNWGYVALYQEQPDGSFVRIDEQIALGTWKTLPLAGTVCGAASAVTVPSDGNYRAVISAGYLFGPLQRATLLK